jgi:hypothetical protein
MASIAMKVRTKIALKAASMIMVPAVRDGLLHAAAREPHAISSVQSKGC